MKTKLHILFILIYSFSTAQNSFYVDSVQKSIQNLPDSIQLQSILQIPYNHFISEIATSEKLIKSATDFAIELNDSLALADIYLKLSQISAYKDKNEQKIKYILKAIKIYENLEETLKAGTAYGQLGYSIKSDNIDKAFYYMRKSISLIESTNNTTKIDPIYDNYGTLHLLNKNIDSSLFFHKKSLLLKKQLNDNVGLGFGYANLADTYIELKKFNIAKKYIDSSLSIRKKIKDNYGIAVSYTHIGDFYFAKYIYIQAIKNYKISFNLAKKNKYQHLEKYCAEQITKSYLELKDYKNAFNYNKIFQTLKDSTLNLQTNTRVAELQIEFETEKKEKEIAQQKELLLKNELELKNKNIYTILLASSILLLSIIIFGLYKRQKHKHREYQNQLKLKEAQTYNKLQDQRLRISRDLHDNIGSQLTFIISSIDNLKFLTNKSNKKLIYKLSEINKFASSTISQLRDTIWAMNKTEINLEDFQSRILSFIKKAENASPNIQFNFNTTVKNKVLFSSLKGMHIFRVIQESINNALKYANASEISVTLNEIDNYIFFKINDNGKGFDLNNVKLGNGLKNMQQRINEINAEIIINSKINIGTSIIIKCSKNKTNVV